MATLQTPFIYPSYMGSLLGCTQSGTATAVLDAADEHVAFVGKIPKTGTINKIGFSLSASSSPDLTLRAALETVDLTAVGAPVATTTAGSTLYVANASGTVVNPGTGVHWIALNGGSGVAVTKGDDVSITVRVSSFTSGSVTIRYGMFGPLGTASIFPYTYTYLNSTATPGSAPGNFALQYATDGCVPLAKSSSAVSIGTESWMSSSNPDRRGLRFKMPWACTINGIVAMVDQDIDTTIKVYDSDEFTELASVALDSSNRYQNGHALIQYEFPSSVTLAADTAYRVVLLPTSTTNIVLLHSTVTDDGGNVTMKGLEGGAEWYWTQFNGTPNSGSHVWTDTATKRPHIGVIVDSITASGGGERYA